MIRSLPPARRLASAALAAAAAAALPATLGAQQPMGQGALGQSSLAAAAGAGARTVGVSPRIETWSFGEGLYQLDQAGGDSVRLGKVMQWSVPVTAVIPLGSRFTFDVAAAYAHGEVTLEGTDPDLDTDSYTLSGLSDARLRVTGRFLNDNLVLTLGYDAPTGATELDAEEFAAARVLAAPALALSARPWGTGGAGSAGIVFARQAGSVAWAVGASYELRQGYSPVGTAGGLPSLELDPSDAIHLSLAADRTVGSGAMTFVLGADIFGESELRNEGTSSSSGVIPPNTAKLGPVLSAEWQWRLASARFRELSLTVVDRYRTGYEQEGEEVEGGSANYLEAALNGLLPIGGRTDLVTGLEFRHHTGLDADPSLVSAGFVGGGLTLGLAHDLGGFVLQPFVRGQMGRFESNGNNADATGVSVGITLGTRF
jgi:hypothetical protein